MAESEIEVEVNPKIRGAVQAAVDKIGKQEFSKLSGVGVSELDHILSPEQTYVRVTAVSVACQVNKSHGDTDNNLSSVSECLKGAIYRIPKGTSQPPTERRKRRPVNVDEFRPRRSTPAFFDQKSIRILNLSANTLSFLALGYFLGGIVLAPVFGLPQCIGLESRAPWVSPCLGSVLGLAIGSVMSLAYTSYYFVKKM